MNDWIWLECTWCDQKFWYKYENEDYEDRYCSDECKRNQAAWAEEDAKYIKAMGWWPS